jgi:hypothetical protein
VIWRIPLSVLLWLARIAIFLPLALLGLLPSYVLAHADWCEPRHSAHFNRTVLQWRTIWLFWPWSNSEDGVDGLRGGDPAQQWWADKTRGMSPAKRIWLWAAVRNPVDNLRFVPLLNPRIDPARIRFIGMDHEPAKGEGGWYFAWQGLYSCIRFETKTWRLWVGWKFKPEDRLGLRGDDPRSIRCDFALQLKRIV